MMTIVPLIGSVIHKSTDLTTHQFPKNASFRFREMLNPPSVVFCCRSACRSRSARLWPPRWCTRSQWRSALRRTKRRKTALSSVTSSSKWNGRQLSWGNIDSANFLKIDHVLFRIRHNLKGIVTTSIFILGRSSVNEAPICHRGFVSGISADIHQWYLPPQTEYWVGSRAFLSDFPFTLFFVTIFSHFSDETCIFYPPFWLLQPQNMCKL